MGRHFAEQYLSRSTLVNHEFSFYGPSNHRLAVECKEKDIPVTFSTKKRMYPVDGREGQYWLTSQAPSTKDSFSQAICLSFLLNSHLEEDIPEDLMEPLAPT